VDYSVDLFRAQPAGAERSGMSPALHTFIAYSRKDAKFLDQLRAALVPHERVGTLSLWCDVLVKPGQMWEHEIIDRLERAQIVICCSATTSCGHRTAWAGSFRECSDATPAASARSSRSWSVPAATTSSRSERSRWCSPAASRSTSTISGIARGSMSRG